MPKETNEMKYDRGIIDYLKFFTLFLEDGKLVIDSEFDYPYQIGLIDHKVREITQSKRPLFMTTRSRHGRGWKAARLGGDLQNCLRTFSDVIPGYYNKNKFGPYFTLFMRYVDRLRLADEALRYRGDVTSINTLIEEMRNEAHQSDFQSYYAKVDRSARKNSQSLNEYLRALFNMYSKLLVVRIDLGYDRRLTPSLGREISPIDVIRDREKFLRHLRRKYPSLAGYIWKLEYGLAKSYHIHFLILFDGHKVRNDVAIGNLLGEHWRTNITRGIGMYWNCNGTKKRYARLGTLGIGAVGYDDKELRKNLVNAASYLAKSDYYVRLKEPNLGNTFGKGLMPKKPSSRKGRRRECEKQGKL